MRALFWGMAVVGIFFVLRFAVPAEVQAVPSSSEGNVYMRINGTKIALPGVKVWRMDRHGNFCVPPGEGKCWGVNDGVESTTTGIGNYYIGNDGNNPGPVPLSVSPWVCMETEGPGTGSTLCPVGPMRGVSDRGVAGSSNIADCDRLNWCGYNCGSNPHKWTPYFPEDYTWLQNEYPQVPFNVHDLYGGGRFVPMRGHEECPDGWEEDQWWVTAVDNSIGMRGCDFEWIPPVCNLTCTLDANPSTVFHSGGGIITLTMTATDVYSTVDWDWKPGTTPCGTLRTDPLDVSRAYVDFETGDICTGQVVAIVTGACSAQCQDEFSIINRGPEVVSVVPNAGVSGTLSDDDNGATCTDNNPQVFTVTYRDADGCGDIESAYVWFDDMMPSAQQLHSSAHAAVFRSGGEWKKYGQQCVNRCDQGSSYSWTIGGAEVSSDESPTPYLFSPNNYDTHSDCLSRGGSCSHSAAAIDAFLAVCSGDTLTVRYKVWFYDDQMGSDLAIYGYVRDEGGATDGWDPIGSRGLDFNPPDVAVSLGNQAGDPSNTVRFVQEASDNEPHDWGLSSIYDRRYWIMRWGTGRLPPVEGAAYDIGADITELGGAPQWSVQDGPVPSGPGDSRPLFVAGDVVTAEITAVDVACNAEANQYTATPVGHPWVQTFNNDVYGFLGMYDPIPISGVALGNHWVGGNTVTSCSSVYTGLGVVSLPGWCSSSYEDANRRAEAGDWYLTLRALAQRNGSISQRSSWNDVMSSVDGVYEYVGASLEVTGTCSGRKVIFIPDGVTVSVSPPFTVLGGSACLFVGHAGSRIVVEAGEKAVDSIDNVWAGFITDGVFLVQPDIGGPPRDRLFIHGFVFADEVYFLRDLELEDNLLYPGVTIEYDARYLHLLRDMLGQMTFESFECGIVTGSKACEGWSDVAP